MHLALKITIPKVSFLNPCFFYYFTVHSTVYGMAQCTFKADEPVSVYLRLGGDQGSIQR